MIGSVLGSGSGLWNWECECVGVGEWIWICDCGRVGESRGGGRGGNKTSRQYLDVMKSYRHQLMVRLSYVRVRVGTAKNGGPKANKGQKERSKKQ